ncbi:HD domain-containing protein [Alteromonas flava]|uniref:HD domain-containing protein n=1 Tax=Alteromonas flava TaxID=2048003 RepID=UPI000C282568|nr:HD domain-containing protein [Alteromonas flava]
MQQISFIRELDKLKAVHRKALIRIDNNRFENSAEHSWHVALVAQILAPYANENIDISRVISMLLIHDIVEIDAGDTFAFEDNSVQIEQAIKEKRAAERIFGMLPEPQRSDFLSLWNEFEKADSADARFANSIDRILPLIQNMANGGGSWVNNNVYKHQVIRRNKFLKVAAPELWEFALSQIEVACLNGWLKE